MYRKEIVYDRETRDFAMYLDSELVGFARTYHEAEVTLDQLVFELISGEFFRDAPTETRALIAAPALVFEATCALCEESKPESEFEAGHAVLICNECRAATAIPAADWGAYVTASIDTCACGQPTARLLHGVADTDIALCSTCYAHYSALPAAPTAQTIARTPNTFSGPSDSTVAGREDAPILMPEGDWLDADGMRVDPPLAQTANPDPAAMPAAPDSWTHRETHCQHLTACDVSSCPACDPTPTSFRCPLCETNEHRATQCPDVALTKYGLGVWEAYIENRAAFLKLVQWAAAPRLVVMGDAVAHYLSTRWGHAITGYQVLACWKS
jgi:hypothetical protein